MVTADNSSRPINNDFSVLAGEDKRDPTRSQVRQKKRNIAATSTARCRHKRPCCTAWLGEAECCDVGGGGGGVCRVGTTALLTDCSNSNTSPRRCTVTGLSRDSVAGLMSLWDTA